MCGHVTPFASQPQYEDYRHEGETWRLLRSTTNASGYACVYKRHTGRYAAHVKEAGERVGCHPFPAQP